MKGASPTGHFGTLALEIQETILLKLTAKDMASMERCSTHFRSVIVDGQLWRRKASHLGRRVVALMEEEMKKMKEKREERNCMFPIHPIITHLIKEQNKEDAVKGGGKIKKDETGVEDENMPTDDKCKAEPEDREKVVTDKKESDEEGDQSSDEMDDTEEIDSSEDEAVCEEANAFHFYTHTRVSTRWDPEGEEVDCGMVICDLCLDTARTMNRNREFKCPKCDVKTVLDDWDASIQIEMDKEEVRKEKLERILGSPTEGKQKMKEVLELMMKEPPFPSIYWDMAWEEGMQEEDEDDVGSVECVVM